MHVLGDRCSALLIEQGCLGTNEELSHSCAYLASAVIPRLFLHRSAHEIGVIRHVHSKVDAQLHGLYVPTLYRHHERGFAAICPRLKHGIVTAVAQVCDNLLKDIFARMATQFVQESAAAHGCRVQLSPMLNKQLQHLD